MAKKEPSIHQYKTKIPMKEMYKFEHDLSPPWIGNLFQVQKNTFNLTYFQKMAN